MARHARGSLRAAPWIWIILLLIIAGLAVPLAGTLSHPVAAPQSSSAPRHPHSVIHPHKPQHKHHSHPRAAEQYTVRPGDSLWSIAVKHYHSGLAWHQLYVINMKAIGNNPGRIFPGQTLTLIGGI